MSDLVLIEARGSVALITLNRPVKLNALDYALIDRLLEILDLLATAFALAHTIAAKSPLAVAACLGSVTRGLNVAIDEGLAIEASWFARMAGTRGSRKEFPPGWHGARRSSSGRSHPRPALFIATTKWHLPLQFRVVRKETWP